MSMHDRAGLHAAAWLDLSVPSWEVFLVMGLKTLVVYAATIAMIRIGKTRWLGKNTVFDVIMGFILGSMLSRTINGTAPLLPTLLAGFALVGAHYVMSLLTFHGSRIGAWVKGQPERVVEDGRLLEDRLKKHLLTHNDLDQNLRMNGGVSSLDEVEEAWFERSGDISIVRRRPTQDDAARAGPADAPTEAPNIRVLDVKVQEGVQTVRIVMP